MKLFFVFMFFIHLIVNIYIFLRGWQAIPQVATYKIIYTVCFACVALSFVFSMLLRETLPLKVLKVTYAIGTTWLACMLYFTITFLFTDIIHLLNRWFHFLPDALLVNFRQIQVLFCSGIVMLLLIIGHYRFTHPSIETYNLAINKKAGNRKSLRIVGISDIHLGLLVDKKRFNSYVEKINSLKPDIIFIAGDLIDNSTRILKEENLHEEVNRLKAPLGVYYALGNHEYITGIENSMEFLKRTNMHLMIDSAASVNEEFWVIGRDDRVNTDRKKLKDLVAQTDQTQPLFLLDHQPFHLEEGEENGIDLQLFGHTHNGQLWPFNIIIKNMYEVGYGYKKKGNTHVYVSSGLALWGPLFRIGTKSEIVVFNLEFKE